MTYKQQLIITLIDKALLGVLLVFIGYWLNRTLERVKHELGLDAARFQLTLQSKIQFKEKQLSEFYGPIYALLKQIRPIDDLWNQRKLGSADRKIVKTIRKANDRIVEIILTKSHLIQGESIPASYTGFLTHVAVWHAYQDDPKADWSIFEQLTEAHYDMNFEREIFETTEALKKELYDLYQQNGLKSDGRR